MKVHYEYLIKDERVNNGRITIKNTRIEPRHIVKYGTIDEIMNDFKLTRNQVIEAFHYELISKMTDEDKKNIIDDWKAVGEYFKKVMK